MAQRRKPIIDVEQERALLAQAREGDKRAMERLIAAHYPAMYHLALRYTRDPERALDATQDSCVQVMRHLGSIQVGSAVLELDGADCDQFGSSPIPS